MNMTQRVTLLGILLAGVGCSSSNSFQVEVTNSTNRPVTLWLTKDGPPAEEGWLSPEELATASAHAHGEPSYDFAVVEAGRTGFTDKVTGNFPPGTHAVLRVYDDTPTYFQIADAAKAGKPIDHADQVLKPGNNRFQVTDDASGKLVLHRK